MSRTKRGGKGPGYDFGAKYKCNSGYGGGIGEVPKSLAKSERRSTGKTLARSERD